MSFQTTLTHFPTAGVPIQVTGAQGVLEVVYSLKTLP
jgi:hypothetical protein